MKSAATQTLDEAEVVISPNGRNAISVTTTLLTRAGQKRAWHLLHFAGHSGADNQTLTSEIP